MADSAKDSFTQHDIRRTLGVCKECVACALETVEHPPLSRADVSVPHYLHDNVKVLQIRFGEIGDRGEMIEVDRFRCQSLAGKMNVVRARPAAAKATASRTRTSRFHRSQIEHMDRPFRCFRRKRIEGKQPCRQKNQDWFQVVHLGISGIREKGNPGGTCGRHFVVGLKINCEKL